jgi:hypothetical protein
VNISKTNNEIPLFLPVSLGCREKLCANRSIDDDVGKGRRRTCTVEKTNKQTPSNVYLPSI